MSAELPRRLVAEAVGTALLVLFGAGSVVAALKLGKGVLDFPGLGMDQDALVVTGNIFDCPTKGCANKGAAVAMGLAKARLYNGLSFGGGVPLFSTGTLQPSVVLDQNPAQFLTAARTDTDKIDLFRCTELEKPAAASCVLQSSIGVGFDMAVPPAATQPGGAETLDTLDGRFENRGTEYTTSIGGTPW